LKKAGKVLLGVIALTAGLSLTSYFYVRAQNAEVQRQLRESQEKSAFTPEEILEDIAFFRHKLANVHPRAIPSIPLGNVATELAELERSIDGPLTHLEFYRKLAPVVGMLDDEHTMVFPPERNVRNIYAKSVGLFPFDVEFIDDRLYVAENLFDETEIRPGAEIVSINGFSADRLRQLLVTYFSGTGEEQKLFYAQEKFQEALFLALGFSENFELIMRGPNQGDTRNYTIAGRAVLEPVQEEFGYELIDDVTILFTYNTFEDKDERFSQFLEEMFTTAERQGVQNLIIDIRRNQGGASAFGDELLSYLSHQSFAQFSRVDTLISDEIKKYFLGHVPAFLRWFPVQYFHPFLRPLWQGEVGETASVSFDEVEPGDNALRFSGDVYLLIGPGTMSSASLLAATLQKHNLATMVGSPAGGYATLYGNVIDVYLPHSGLKVWMPTGIVYGNSFGPIVPEHVVSQFVQDIVRRRDTVLEYTVELARSK
jgi:hypothetical protein